MSILKFLRGKRSNLPEEKIDGSIYICTDDMTIHFDYIDENGNIQRDTVVSGNHNDILNDAKLYADKKFELISSAVLYTPQLLTEEQI